MREPPLTRILLVDDDEDDYLLTRALCQRVQHHRLQLDWADSFEQGRKRIANNEHDVVLIDFRLGAKNGLELLREVAPHCHAPCILLTGQGGHSIDMEAMRAGAVDYLAKDDMNAPLLERTIRYAIERKRSEEHLQRLALYDPLTGLANRSLFHDRLTRELARAARHGHGAALLFIDLDRFKTINDSLGHSAGDDLLREMAGRLSRCTRKVDTVARLSGDEFVIILAEVASAAHAEQAANRIISAMATPIELAGKSLLVTGSVGITYFPSDGESTETLLKNADMAMYEAKAQGGNRYCSYRAEMAVRAARRLELENRIRHALSRREFRLSYQPIVSLDDRSCHGVEALLRWQLDDTLLGPSEFLPLLEDTGLICDVGDWVIDQACRQQRAWLDAGLAPPPTSVNVSRAQLSRRGLVQSLESALATHQLEGERLVLELTESVFMTNPAVAEDILRRVTAMGVRVALDDFGTGYSSLNCLRRFPVSVFKLDRSLLLDMTGREDERRLVRAVAALGKNLGMTVVAEGIETAEQLAIVTEAGCDAVQGFLFSRPLSAADFADTLRADPRAALH